MLPYDARMAAAQGRRALRRGDLDAAERWFRLADRAMAIAQRISRVAIAEEDCAMRHQIYRNPR